jgi:glycolate oxidase
MSFAYDEPVDGKLPNLKRELVVKEMKEVLPDVIVLHEPEQLRPFECDGLSAYRTIPLCVVLPEAVEQVQQVLRFAKTRGIPVLARGAGTGLSGGAMPLEKGILLVMTKFNRIVEIDPFGCTARVQPGVRNLAISQAVSAQGLYYAPDPSSQIACSIGGNVAECGWRALSQVRPDSAQYFACRHRYY